MRRLKFAWPSLLEPPKSRKPPLRLVLRAYELTCWFAATVRSDVLISAAGEPGPSATTRASVSAVASAVGDVCPPRQRHLAEALATIVTFWYSLKSDVETLPMIVELWSSVTSFDPCAFERPVASEFAPSAVARVRVSTTILSCSTIAFSCTFRPVTLPPSASRTCVKAEAPISEVP